MKYDIKVWQGETIPFAVEWDTDISATATILIYKDNEIHFEETKDFLLNKVEFNIQPLDEGTYEWLIRIDFPDGTVDIIPNRDCTDCEKPKLEVC